MTSDMWLKPLLKKLLYRGGGVNSIGCRGILVGTKSKSCCRGLGGGIGMERTDGAFDEK